MQIERLRVREIRSYVQADVQLGPGTTLLSGDVGSGKTSLLHAIEMALFGFAEVDAGYLVRHRAGRAEVALTLAEGTSRYTLERRFRRILRKGQESFKVDENSLKEDGRRTQYSVTELKRRAIELLGFPDNPNPRAHSDLWRWAVYVPQEQMREILQSGPEERLTTVRKALGVEQYSTARENAEVLAHTLRREAQTRAQAAERLHVFEEELAEAQREAVRAAQERERWRAAEAMALAAHQAAQQAWAAAAERLRQLEGDRREHAQLTERRAELTGHAERVAGTIAQRTSARARLVAERAALPAHDAPARQRAVDGEERARAGLAAARANAESARRALTALAAAEADRSARARAVETAAGAIERTQTALADARADQDRLARAGPAHEPPAPTPRTVETIASALRAVQEAYERASARHGALDHERAEVVALQEEGVCPRCHRPVDPSTFRQSLEATQAELAAVRAELDALAAQRRTLDAERGARERFERAHDRWSQVHTERTAAEGRARAAAEEVDRAVAALRAARDEQERAERHLAELRPSRPAAEAAEAALTEAERKLEAASAQVQALDRLGQQDAGLAEQLRLVQDEERRAAEELAAVAEQAAALDAALSRLAERLQAAQGEAGRADALQIEERRHAGSLEQARTALARVDTELAEAGRRAERAGRGVADRRRLQQEGRQFEALGEFLQGPMREGLLTLERQVLARAHLEFDRAFCRFFATLIEDPGLIARTDPTFQAAVEIDGDWTPPEALSGGERTALALAYRLALGQVVRASGRLRLETLILDEPTDGFSPEQVQRMGDLLEELAIPQVILVSHEVGLSAIADRVLRVEKRDGVSQVIAPGAGATGGDGEDAAPVTRAAPRRRRTARLSEAAPSTSIHR